MSTCVRIHFLPLAPVTFSYNDIAPFFRLGFRFSFCVAPCGSCNFLVTTTLPHSFGWASFLCRAFWLERHRPIPSVGLPLLSC